MSWKAGDQSLSRQRESDPFIHGLQSHPHALAKHILDMAPPRRLRVLGLVKYFLAKVSLRGQRLRNWSAHHHAW